MVGIFDPTQAQYYCTNFGASLGQASGSIRDLIRIYRTGHTFPLTEGTPTFDEYRDCLLRDVERRLFLAVSNYRRSLDLMMSSAAAWAHVTLYYASFFVASGLLEMFGCYVANNFIVEVANPNPSSQALRTNASIMTAVKRTAVGPHESFWAIFYQCSPTLRPWVTEARLKVALDPVNGDDTWQIDARNKVNYDTYWSVAAMSNFQQNFSDSNFPTCLQGDLSTQRSRTDLMIELAFSFANQFGLSTDALNVLTPVGSRGTKVNALVLNETLPNISSKLNWAHVI